MTPIFRSWASGRILSSTPRLPAVIVNADEVDRLVAHDRREQGVHGVGREGRRGEVMHADVPDLPSFFISRRTATYVETSELALTMTRSILDTLNFLSFASTAALTAAGSTFRMAPGRTGPTSRGRTDRSVVQNNLS